MTFELAEIFDHHNSFGFAPGFEIVDFKVVRKILNRNLKRGPLALGFKVVDFDGYFELFREVPGMLTFYNTCLNNQI